MRVFLIGLIALCSVCRAVSQPYSPDVLGEGYLRQTIELKDDYEGREVATLVKRVDTTMVPSNGAVLYVHGYNDYFFQTQLADKIDSMGYNFYAIDLRKYGRSYLPNQRLFNVRNMGEYYEEIGRAIEIIRGEGSSRVVLMGHSTGGLTTTLYAYDNPTQIDGLILNSPFYEQNQSWFNRKIMIPIVSMLSYIFPNATIPQNASNGYARSLLSKYDGEWSYNTNWKLEHSPAVTFSWIRAIYQAQKRVWKIREMAMPVLVMHSDKTSFDMEYNASYSNSDVVLNVADIDRYARQMGDNVKIVTIKNGLHDLALSGKDARAAFYEEVGLFLDMITGEPEME